MPLSLIDRLIVDFDKVLRRTRTASAASGRAYPAEGSDEAVFGGRERRRAAGLMRVNHAGEIAAQALYRGQALGARSQETRGSMREAAAEEVDHLAWCERRLEELESRPSRLAPAWFLGSFALGTAAGVAGDAWSLGFVAETERQVVEHLRGHLTRLPDPDPRSRAIIGQMIEDERGHATAALAAGGRELPWLVKQGMRAAAKVMTVAAYWL